MKKKRQKVIFFMLILFQLIYFSPQAFAETTYSTNMGIPPKVANNVNVTTTIDPTVVITISTKFIDFGHINNLKDLDDFPSAVTITVQSNSNFNLCAEGNGDITGTNPSDTIPISDLQIKISTTTSYASLSKTTTITIIGNQPATKGSDYPIDLQLLSSWITNPDSYSTSINFLVSQI